MYSYAVLAILAKLGGGTAYDIERFAEEHTSGFWPIRHSTSHSEPRRLVELGYLHVDHETDGRRRRSFALTAQGRHELRVWVSSPTASPPQLRDVGMLKAFARGNTDAMEERALALVEAFRLQARDVAATQRT